MIIIIIMNKSVSTIKVLRQNFIKKHQLEPNYFTVRQKHTDSDLFNDREMFYPKEFIRKNHQNGKFTIRERQQCFHQNDSNRLKLAQKQDKILTVKPKTITSELKVRHQRQLSSQHYNTIAYQPSFVKTERLKKRVVSARQPRNFIPKYAAYMQEMKPCIIGQIKIESRPQSAILKSKSVEINKFMGYGLKKHRTPTQKQKKEQFLVPWETQYEEL